MSESPLASLIFRSLPQLLPEDSELGRTLTWDQVLLFLRLARRIAPPTYSLSKETLEPNEVGFLAAALSLPDHTISEVWLLLRALVYLLPASDRVSDDDVFRRLGADYKVGKWIFNDQSQMSSPIFFEGLQGYPMRLRSVAAPQIYQSRAS